MPSLQKYSQIIDYLSKQSLWSEEAIQRVVVFIFDEVPDAHLDLLAKYLRVPRMQSDPKAQVTAASIKNVCQRTTPLKLRLAWQRMMDDVAADPILRIMEGAPEYQGFREYRGARDRGLVPHLIRIWAEGNGMRLGIRGRIPKRILEQYREACLKYELE